MGQSSRRLLAGLFGLALAIGVAKPALAAHLQVDGPALDLSGFELSFEDDFSKPDIVAHGPFSSYTKGTRWIAHTPWNGDFGDARFTDPGPGGPFGFGPQGLTITATKQADGTWHSGLICSVDHDGPGQQGFSQRYGYFEMRAKLPEGPGTWPAFWLMGTDKTGGAAELDVLEYYGKFPDGFHSTIHHWHTPSEASAEYIVDVAPNSLTQDFHDYGVLIDPDHIQFFLDRKRYLEIATPPVFRQPMYMLANLALGAGYPIADLASPAIMRVAFIRAYRSPASTSKP